MSPQSPVRIRLLGPVEAERDGVALALGGRRQRALLALLAIQVGHGVAADVLVEELWAGEPTDGADVTLRSYVSRLRHALGDGVDLRATAAGYTLDIPPDQIDVAHFEQLIRDGDAALLRRNPRRAAELLRTALGLWRGRPFGAFADDGALRIEAERLEELRLRAVEQRIEADLALGGSGELVDELEGLLRDHPYREGLWRQLMLALYRSERQADALNAYHRAREALQGQLGLDPGRELQELEGAILRQEVPPASPPEERHNLPAPLTSFVGRHAELAAIAGLMADARLVVLTGVGGVGKTRLALEVARLEIANVPDGIFFVDLAPLTDPDLVPVAVASVLEVREQSGESLVDSLRGRLRDRETLLVLDNGEHLRDAVADLARALLAAAPGLRILATSREALGVPGEVDYPVPPLSLSPAAQDLDAIRASDAVQLFLARARAARPGLRDDDDSLLTAWRICSDLDGLPLAMELAAARARALSLTDIAARLNDRFRFLVSWRRLTAARHRTLREAMDWSFQLLGADEQRLLAEVSVFAGGFTLAAVSAVCLAGDEPRALELLERLVESSLVSVEEQDDETRYRLLETVRQYATEQLSAAGATADVARRHAEHYADLAESLYAPIRLAPAPDVTEGWVRRLTRERDNLRTALAWGRDRPDPDLQLRIAEAMWFYWWIRGDLSEGRAWLDPAVAAATDTNPTLRALATAGAAGLAWASGDLDAAQAFGETARAAFHDLGEASLEATAANTLGLIALHRGENEAAESMLLAALRIQREGDSPPRERDINVAIVLNNLGEVALARGDLEAATANYLEARAVNRANDVNDSVNALNLGIVAVYTGRLSEARELLREGLETQWRLGFMQHVAEGTEGIAALANVLGEHAEAAILLGGTGRIRSDTGHRAFAWNARMREQELAVARTALGEPATTEAYDAGHRLSAPEVVDRALGLLRR